MLELGGWNKAKEAGEVKNVSRDYVVEDGDYVVILATK
jgi:ribosome-binding ATPase YchF (GTP1/OBG family)